MTEQQPILVLGAGINGAAIARELVLNGVPVVLVDTADLAFGATAYASRLIHGGLRYLEYGEFDLVRESLAERTRLLPPGPAICQTATPVYSYREPLWRVVAIGRAILVQGGTGDPAGKCEQARHATRLMAGADGPADVRRVRARPRPASSCDASPHPGRCDRGQPTVSLALFRITTRRFAFPSAMSSRCLATPSKWRPRPARDSTSLTIIAPRSTAGRRRSIPLMAIVQSLRSSLPR